MPNQLSVTLGGSTVVGSSAPAALLQPGDRDDRFIVWLGTGTSPSAQGVVATITLGSNLTSLIDLGLSSSGNLPPIAVSFVLGGMSAAHAQSVISAGLVYSLSTYQVIIATTSSSNFLPASLPASSGGIGVVGLFIP